LRKFQLRQFNLFMTGIETLVSDMAQALTGEGSDMAGAANPSTAQPNVFGQSAGALTNAMRGAESAMAFRPQQVSTQTAAGGISTYMNPYTQSVIDTSMADLERQRQMQMNQLGAQASAAGAFGGSRQGVAESLTNEAFARQGGQLASGLRQQGFNTALGASQQDVSNFLQAGLANQGAEQQAAALRAQAASQLGNLAQTGFGMGMDINQQQMQQGMLQQALQQQLIDTARAQYGGFTGAPQASLGLPMAALGAANMGQQTQTGTYNPGLFDYLSLGVSAINPFKKAFG
jgi:hypothetical protein